MKILFVADVPPDPNSGAAGTDFQTIEALRSLGHTVDALWDDSLPHRIRHHNLHYLLELPRGFRRAIADACRDQRYDVIHCSQPHAWLAAREHRNSCRDGIFVCRSHGFEARAGRVLREWRRRLGLPERPFPKSLPGYFIDQAIERSCRLAARYCDGYIVSCSEDRDFLASEYRLSTERVACIHQAPPELFRQTAVRPFFSERLTNLLVVGPPQFWKGPHVLGQALDDVFAHHPDVTLTWVCAENDQSGARRFLSAGVQRRTVFSPPVPQDRLMEIYDAHGILLFPSLFEGFGKAFLEGMARGLCVVASNTGGMRDIIHHAEDGMLTGVGDAADFSAALLRLLEHPEQARLMAARAVVTAGDHSWDRVGRETLNFFQALTERRKTAGSSCTD